MLLPDQEDYGSKQYLRDALRAWGAYWHNQHILYFKGSLKKDPTVSAWEEWRPIVWFLVAVGAFIAGCWMVARGQHYQIMPYHGPTKLTPFTTTTTGPAG